MRVLSQRQGLEEDTVRPHQGYEIPPARQTPTGKVRYLSYGISIQGKAEDPLRDLPQDRRRQEGPQGPLWREVRVVPYRKELEHHHLQPRSRHQIPPARET